MRDGSELHRLTEMKPYDQDMFNRLYKSCRPLIKNLVNQVDTKRLGVTKDLVTSYFWDKFLYVFNKYQGEYTENRLKATLLSSLSTFKNKLLRSAYGEKAEFNQSMTSFEVLFDNSKELLDDSEETRNKEYYYNQLHEYIKKNLTPDEYLLFKTLLDPPEYILERLQETRGKISSLILIDFFRLPRTVKSEGIIRNMRRKISSVIEQAKVDLGHQDIHKIKTGEE